MLILRWLSVETDRLFTERVEYLGGFKECIVKKASLWTVNCSDVLHFLAERLGVLMQIWRAHHQPFISHTAKVSFLFFFFKEKTISHNFNVFLGCCSVG